MRRIISLLLLVFLASCVYCNECNMPWHHYDSNSNTCQCYNSPNTHGIVRCHQNERVELLIGYCMTIDEEGVTYVGSCPNNYPIIDYQNTTEAVYIVLPNNKSELNDYMCGGNSSNSLFKRTGKVCGECLPGYAPAVHQAGFVCSKCEWYGIPVYLLLEFGPVTLFFIFILMFRISLTSAPMIAFVVYCQLVTNVLTYNASIAKAFILHLDSAQSIIFHAAATIGGIWNLDFLRFVTIIPPVCLTEGIKNSHVILLGYVSAIYPQILIAITFITIQIYNSPKYGKGLVWLCRPLRSRMMINIRKNFDPKKSVLDVFTTFIVLSYSKLALVSLVSMAFTKVYAQGMDGQPIAEKTTTVMAFDTTLQFLQGVHFPIAALGLFVSLIFGAGPPIFLLLYPTKCIGRTLKKLKLNRALAIVNDIAQKFNYEYRDKTEAKYNLTYLAGMYMFVASASYFVVLLEQISAQLSWFGTAIFLVTVSIFILAVRPHKHPYQNIVSGLIITLPALYCIMYVVYIYNIVLIPTPSLGLPVWVMCFVFCLPQAIFISYVIYKPIRNSQKCQIGWGRFRAWCSKKRRKSVTDDPYEMPGDEEPDRLRHPERDEYSPKGMNRMTSRDEMYSNEPNTVQYIV